MLRIVKESIDLDIPAADVRWECVNTLFEDNAFQSDFTFPFVLPFTATNMKAFGFAHKPDVVIGKVSYPVVVFIGNGSISCMLILTGTTTKGYQVSVAAGINGLNNADKKLADLNFTQPKENPGAGVVNGQIDFGSGLSSVIYNVANNWKSVVAFPSHYNPDFYGAVNPDFQGVVNRVDTFIGTLKTNDVYHNYYAIVPFIYFHYIIKTIADENGLTLRGTAWYNKDIASLLMYNNYAMDKSNINVNLRVRMLNDMTYASIPGSYPYSNYRVPFRNDVLDATDPANTWDNTTHRDNNGLHGDYDVTAYIQYKILGTTADVVVAIYKNGGFLAAAYPSYLPNGVPATVNDIHTQMVTYSDTGVLTTDNYEVYVITKSVGAPVTVILNTSYFEKKKVDGTIINIHDQVCTLKNHVWDITVSTFFQKYKNLLKVRCDINWNDMTLTLDTAEDTIQNTRAIDITDQTDPNYIQTFEDKKSNGYKLSYDFGTSDALLTGNLLPYDKKKYLGDYATKADLPTGVANGYYASVRNKNKLMKVVASAWVEYSDFYYTIITDNDNNTGKDIKIDMAPMMMTDAAENERLGYGGGSPEVRALMPTILELGTSVLFDIVNTPSFRVVFMKGDNITTAVGGHYVLASATDVDLNGNIVGNINLSFEGTNNIYTGYLETLMLAVDNSQVFQYLIQLPYNYMTYKGRFQINNVNYLVKKISMPLGRTQKPSLVDLLKL